MASRIGDRNVDGDKLDLPQENQSSATSFSVTTNGLATSPEPENITEQLNLPNFIQSEIAGNFQEDGRGQGIENVESGGSQQVYIT